MIDKLTDFLYKYGNLGILCFSLAVALISFFDPFQVQDGERLSVLALAFIYLAFMGVYIYIVKKIKNETTIHISVQALIFLVFLIQLYIAYKMRLIPKVDLSHVIDEASQMLESNSLIVSDEKYFGSYTNNIPILILIYWVFRVGKSIGFTDLRLFGGIFNVLLLFIMYQCCYSVLRKLTNLRTAAMVMFVVLSNPAFFAYASYYYTDTISLSLVSISAFLYLKAVNIKNTKIKNSYFLCVGIVICFAIKIRITSIFICLAILVFHIFNKSFRVFIKQLIPIIAGIVVFLFAWSQIYNMHIPFDTKETAVPIEHFLMMASKDKGTYKSEDVKFTRSLPTQKEKKEATRKEYVKRLRENGIIGNIKLVAEKEGIVWGLGTHGYVQYTQFVSEDSTCYQWIVGEKSKLFKTYMQTYNGILFLFIAGGCIVSIFGSMENYRKILIIYFLGAITFYVFWEAHPRHSISLLVPVTFMIIPLMNADKHSGMRVLI